MSLRLLSSEENLRPESDAWDFGPNTTFPTAFAGVELPATYFYQRHGLGRTVVQGHWRDQTTARVYVDDSAAFARPRHRPPNFARFFLASGFARGLALRPRIRQKEGGRLQRSCAYFTNMFPILVLHILSIFFGVPFKGQ